VVFTSLVFRLVLRNFSLAVSLVPSGTTDFFPLNHLDLIGGVLDAVFLVTVTLWNDYVLYLDANRCH